MKKPRGIRYISEPEMIWKRVKKGKHWQFVNRLGRPVKTKDQERIKKLVIPPAWTDVKISPLPNSHVQAIGTDAKGRKQYIYHPQWVEYNQKHKFDSMLEFAEVLPTLRETIKSHMRQRNLSRERVLATVVWLLENTFIRVGNKAYAKENQSYGLTTMRTKHVDVDGNTITFSFKGKSHVYHELDIKHPRVATTIKQCIELPGYEIFKYLDEDKKRRIIDSSDVNNYLKEITGQDLSAKDFRTWGGTTLAGDMLYRLGNPSDELPLEKAITQAITAVSEHLGNTTTVCRQYYVHPKVIKSYEKNLLVPTFEKIKSKADRLPNGLRWAEHATLQLLTS